MARDCPDRQKGASWRNDGPPRAAAGRIGSGDAVDREYEQFLEELGGGSSGTPARIEAAPGSYNNGNSGGDAKPWQRGPTGAAAPWRSRNNDQNNESGGGGSAPWRDRHRGNDNHGGDYYGGQGQNYNSGSAPGAAAPWHQASSGQPQYPSYPGYSGYGAAPGMGPPPGLAPPGGSLGAPPGLPPGNINALIQQYSNGAAPPPPPPSGDAPPPPPGDQPPPPPPGA
ncbi:hypothetical protein F4813DRAFT_156348 [Daldinia decipiens]|uniref:uncharacterized protein n=1 Tax=Daldinia decipiens TaxID=326647 RepID=UPI0020C4741F|nr:uncharacterized protein F4813DRAFT_156348 [Daldinia decipiens]KAI1655590.1 hypothetical protein F4813DRAFT_156348 [Daldinia decipiens]